MIQNCSARNVVVALLVFADVWAGNLANANAQQNSTTPQNTNIAPIVYTTDEQINIRVYESGNRSVANIQTEFEGVDRFFRPVSGEGSGSGWVYDQAGHVVTNYHVIEDSDRIKVKLHDGQSAHARIVGVDPQNDIAVLKIDVPAESLIPLVLGCLLYTSPSPRDQRGSRMPSSA